jgi:probable F420-dependent oxidoreductase
MQYWLAITTIPEQEHLLAVARLAEAAGFHGLTLADHLVMPTHIESRYPYTEDGAMWWPPDTPWPDPWVTLAAMAAVTTRLRFASNICLAALRDPIVLGKAVSTAAVLSGGRMVLGVAAGWMREEYQLLGVDFATRGRRLDELLAVMRRLWSAQPVTQHGEFFDFDEAIMCPPPPARVPVWCGGASAPALRRAARNEGWLGLPLDRQQARPMIETLRRERALAGLDPLDFAINIALTEAHTPEVIAELQDLGVTGLMVLAPWQPNPFLAAPWYDAHADPACIETKRAALERFAEQVIRRH